MLSTAGSRLRKGWATKWPGRALVDDRAGQRALGIRAAHAEALEAVAELVAGDAEELGGAGLVVGRRLHGALHHLALHRLERHDAGGQRRGDGGRRTAALDVERHRLLRPL